MAGPTYVNATDIDAWAARRDAQSMLPRVIRRLVHATLRSITQIDFPADEGVQLAGWDGIVITLDSNAFVPEGQSVWEFGTSGDIKAKADSDYEKRTKDPLGLDPSQAVFVFVTPRRWGGKSRWVRDRKNEKLWRDVRAYDASDLEQWLELAPAVHIWLSTLLGKHAPGVEDMSTFWTTWSECTHPVLTPDLVLAGRKDEDERVRKWLDEEPSCLAVASETLEEVLAFVSAVAYQMSVDARVALLSRMVIVSDPVAWQMLIATNSSLVLLPRFDVGGMAQLAIRKGHYVLVPLDRVAAASSSSVLQLPRLRRQAALESLVAMGVPEKRAEELATLARQSLTMLRRRLSTIPSIQRPAWAEPAEAQRLIPAVLVGTWNESNDEDRRVIERLAGVSYDQVSEFLTRWANSPDAPVRRVANTWMVVSKLGMWQLLTGFVTSDHLDNFESVALDVLQEVDPTSDIPYDQRLIARAKGTGFSVSSTLRKGLAETVTIMAVFGERCPSGTITGQVRADRIVRALLGKAQEDWRLWASLSRLLKLLAEAAPDAFLAELEVGLSADDSPLAKMFSTDEGAMFEFSPHCDLLWALELLAWSSDYLGRTALALARLATLDPNPDSNHANRPANSLSEIFLSWHPQTSATVAQRIEAVDLLRFREPEIAWRVMVHMLTNRTFATRTARPVWRDWVPDSLPSVTLQELCETTAQIIDRLVADTGHSVPRWRDLLHMLSADKLPVEQRKTIIRAIAQADTDCYSPADATALRDQIREMVCHHSAYPNAKWTLPADEIDLLREALKSFPTDDPEQEHAWLFSPTAFRLLDTPTHDWDECRRAIESQRDAAVREVYASGGLEKLLHMTTAVQDAPSLWRAVGSSDLLSDKEDELLTQGLEADSERAIICGLVAGRFAARKWDWVETKIESSAWRTMMPERRGRFLSCLPFASRTWLLAANSGPETEDRYWSLVNPWGPQNNEAETAVKKLMEHARPIAAVNMIATFSNDDAPIAPISLIADVLEQVVKGPREEDMRLLGHSAYEIADLLDKLEASGRIDTARIAMLEWGLAPVLDHYRGPKLLHRELAQDPGLFVEFVCTVYRAECQPVQEESEQDIAQAKLAGEILESWRTVPGTSDAGVIDEALLRSWIATVRERAKIEGRSDIADQLIGHVFSHCNTAEDGAWPDVPIRNVIEELDSEHVERGLEIQVHNNRGVYTKSLGEGGQQERVLAQDYRNHASALASRWPRTAAVLRRIAQYYEAYAKREDEQVELSEDLGW